VLTIGYAAGICGRNAGRPIIAIGQLTIACVPVGLGLFLSHNPLRWVLGFVTCAFVIGMVDITLQTYSAVLKAMSATREQKRLTDRFEPDSVARAELRARYGLGERPVVLCLSRLVPRKGQDVLIRALPAIRERVDGAVLVIVGGGPYRSTLHQLAHELGVADDVVFTDGVPSDELPAHHAMADVFAMPCRTRGAGLDVEGLGIVYLEASACGVPVVAGRSGGAPESVVDGETGLVVDGEDVGAVATAVGDLLADPARAARMGAAGRKWVVDNWQWRAKGQRLGELLAG